jgi:hypothetical protein
MSLYVLGMMPSVVLTLGIVVCLNVLGGIGDQQIRKTRCELRLPGVAGGCTNGNGRRIILSDQRRRAV